MGERKGQNFYYPPDFDPKKHGSLNGYHGTHALRERAKKIKEGILIIRFEMPYNIWCGGCEKHIGMGVRYNAEKTKVGMYYTTPIYKFRMKCHLCDNYFEIQTDPQNFTYVIVSGARRKEERWSAEDNEQIVTEERDTVKKLANDPMFKLEHDHSDKQNIKKAGPGMGSLGEMQAGKKDDYLLNKLARSQFRSAKNQLKATEAEDNKLLQKSSLDIQLVKEHQDDIRLAGLIKYKNLMSSEERQKQKRDEIMNRPIFQKAAGTPSSSRSSVAALVTPLSQSLVRKKVNRPESEIEPSPASSVDSEARLSSSENVDSVESSTANVVQDPASHRNLEIERGNSPKEELEGRTAGESSNRSGLGALCGYGSSSNGSDDSLDGLS